MDLFSRRIAGWHLTDDMTESLVLAALRSPIKERQPSSDLIHHSDRGGQYARNEYRAVLCRAGIRQSMSRPDNCYDNSLMESFFGTFNTELELTEYEDREEARREAAEYIRNEFTKPVVGLVAGVTAPLGKRMGHAGAIITGSAATAQAKTEALRQAGVYIIPSPAHIGDTVQAILQSA